MTHVHISTLFQFIFYHIIFKSLLHPHKRSTINCNMNQETSNHGELIEEFTLHIHDFDAVKTLQLEHEFQGLPHAKKKESDADELDITLRKYKTLKSYMSSYNNDAVYHSENLTTLSGSGNVTDKSCIDNYESNVASCESNKHKETPVELATKAINISRLKSASDCLDVTLRGYNVSSSRCVRNSGTMNEKDLFDVTLKGCMVHDMKIFKKVANDICLGINAKEIQTKQYNSSNMRSSSPQNISLKKIVPSMA